MIQLIKEYKKAVVVLAAIVIWAILSLLDLVGGYTIEAFVVLVITLVGVERAENAEKPEPIPPMLDTED